MAIQRRVDDSSDYDEVELGRILVTIDDLAALRQIMAHIDKIDESRVTMQFGVSGSRMTDPEDLRELTDSEREVIRLLAPSVTVHLSPYGSLAFGDPKASKAVRDGWAHDRRTTRIPWGSLPRRWFVASVSFFALSTVVVSKAVVDFIFQRVRHEPFNWTGPISLTAWLLTLSLVLGIYLRLTRNSATVVPITLEKYRVERTERRRYWITTGLAAAPLATGAAISILTNVN